jgi:purine-binding chemotaxis protein CheW
MLTQSEKYLIFSLDQEEYGLPIVYVKEINGMLPRTWVPKMPDCVVGLLNLRGKVIPLMDLRIRFHIPPKEYSSRTCIVVVEVLQEQSTKMMGLVVDSVSDVVHIEEIEKEPPSKLAMALACGFIRNVGLVKEKVVLLLEVEKVIDLEETYYHKDQEGLMATIQG